MELRLSAGSELLQSQVSRSPVDTLNTAEALLSRSGSHADHSTLSAATLAQHHAILSAALKAAVVEGLLLRNPATLVAGKPRSRRSYDAVRDNCWETADAHKALAAAKEAGAQMAAFVGLALDSGGRKGELCGLRWSDIDLDLARVTFVRPLLKSGRRPEFGPIKNDVPRTVDAARRLGALLHGSDASPAAADGSG